MCSLEIIVKKPKKKTLDYNNKLYTEYYDVYLTTVLRDETANDLFAVEMEKIPRRRKPAALCNNTLGSSFMISV